MLDAKALVLIKRIYTNTKQTQRNNRADYSWYLPRIDKLYLSHDGKLVVSKGVSGYYLIPPLPNLATDWEFNSDRTTLTMNLVEGVPVLGKPIRFLLINS